MSYDILFSIETGAGECAEVGSWNYTSNVSGMWTKALALPERPWMRDGERVVGRRYNHATGEWTSGVPLSEYGMRLLDGAPASEAAAAERMEANPDDYLPMQPDNGWGDYAGALRTLQWCAEMAAKHPATTMRVSS